MIECVNLTKIFAGNTESKEVCGIRNVNLKFEEGIIYGVIGYNCAGKTTLFNCVEGLYTPTSGFVYHNGVKTTDDREFLPYRRKIAFLPGDEYLYPGLTCLENIQLAVILKTGRKELHGDTIELIKYLEIDKYQDKRFKECSSGMKKKTQIVISLIGDIDTIIWDEPNNGLDIISNIKIKNILKYYKSKNVTILFSSHVIEFMENFIDTFILLREGEVIENNDNNNIISPRELLLGNTGQDFSFAPFKKES